MYVYIHLYIHTHRHIKKREIYIAAYTGYIYKQAYIYQKDARRR
jgi:hypothetical protein